MNIKNTSNISEKESITITPEFEQVFKIMQNDMYRCIFVTGKAGTGKSTLLKYYVQNIAPKGKTVVLAPTGIAAVNAGGQTVHSFFKFPLRIMLEDDEEIKKLSNESIQSQLIRTIEVIIIDEVSMLRADLIDAIDTYLRINMQNYVPFGGKKLIFFGDLFQLAPVLEDKKTEQQPLLDDFKKRYPSPFFFEAKVFKKQPIHLIELQTVHRQKDKDFIEILNRIRTKDIQMYNDPYISTLNQRYNSNFKVDFYDGSINLLTRNADVDEYNQQGLAGLNQKLYSYQGVIKDEFNQNNLPAPMLLELKAGAQVMFLRNKTLANELVAGAEGEEQWSVTVGNGWQNGTLGTIIALDENGIVVKIKEEDNTERLVIVQKETWENIRYEYDPKEKKIIQTVLGTYTQYPLKLAYAITIHKSQGMTFQKVNIDVSNAFAEGQVYVALSRARTLSGITLLKPVDPYKIKINPRVIQFYKRY